MFSSDLLMQLLNLKLMLLLEFLKRQISSSLVVTHVVIPGTRELQKLRSLSRFNSDKLLLLCLSHILKLSEHFLVLQVFELELGSFGLRQVHFSAALLTVIIK